MDELLIMLIEEAEREEREENAEIEARWAHEEAEETFPSFDW